MSELGGTQIPIVIKKRRCVKCAGKHTTESCTKPKEIPPKCYNCGANHLANYRGCVVAKELHALRNKAANPTKLSPQKGKQVTATRNERITTKPAAGEIKTYAAAVRAQPPRMQIQPTKDTNKNGLRSTLQDTDMTINQQLQLILAKLDNQEKMHTTLCDRLDRLEKATSPRGS
jgi:PAX-interacting protein 1